MFNVSILVAQFYAFQIAKLVLFPKIQTII